MQVGTVLEVENRTGRRLKDSVLWALDSHPTVEAAAEALGVHPNTLYRWMRVLGVRRHYKLPTEVQ